MHFVEQITLSNQEKKELLTLWNREYPALLAHKNMTSFNRYLNTLSQQRHLLLLDKTKIVGWYSDFCRNNERWFLMILKSSIHGNGYGTEILNRIKKGQPKLNAWVIDHDREKKQDGEPYPSPLLFYLKNGFAIQPEVRLENEKISAVKIIWESDKIKII